MTIGILGGGQLGYMLALAGYPLGLHFRFLDPSPEAPVGRIAQRVTADYTDHAALESTADRSRSRAGPPRRKDAFSQPWHQHDRFCADC